MVQYNCASRSRTAVVWAHPILGIFQLALIAWGGVAIFVNCGGVAVWLTAGLVFTNTAVLVAICDSYYRILQYTSFDTVVWLCKWFPTTWFIQIILGLIVWRGTCIEYPIGQMIISCVALFSLMLVHFHAHHANTVDRIKAEVETALG